MTIPFLFVVFSYLLGAIPTSFLAAKHIGNVDLRTVGSKNLGATNLYRVLGWKYALPVGLFDIAKGVTPVVFFADYIGHGEWTPVLAGGAAIIGHVLSVFVRFRGGKGVATAAGVVLAISPNSLALSLLVWTLVVWGTGYVSLGSMLAAVVFPIGSLFLDGRNHFVPWVGVIMAAFIVITHRDNIKRLVDGTESRFGPRRGGGDS